MSKVAAGFVIFRKVFGKIEFLLLQTSYGINHWTPPKGHVDPGETELTTALRETREESGLVKEDLKIYEDIKTELKYDVDGVPKQVYYWLAELINPNAKITLSEEHQDFKWLEVDKACEYAKFGDLQTLLAHYDKIIKTKLI